MFVPFLALVGFVVFVALGFLVVVIVFVVISVAAAVAVVVDVVAVVVVFVYIRLRCRSRYQSMCVIRSSPPSSALFLPSQLTVHRIIKLSHFTFHNSSFGSK